MPALSQSDRPPLNSTGASLGRGGDRNGWQRRAALHLLCLPAIGLLAACVPSQAVQGRLSRSYDSAGITRLVLRAAAADAAAIEPVAGGGPITITGQATGGAKGYHSADPNWQETPADEWGLDFVALRSGATLVISSKNEIGYIHHRYAIAGIVLQLPPSVSVVRQVRTLSGSGEPDLAVP